MKAGEVIRINAKLQDAATGRIISSERADAVNEAALFPTVDDLTRRIKARFTSSGGNPLTGLLRSPAPADSPIILDRDLKDVTTLSVEAYRYYAEAIDLHYRARYPQALPLLQKAIEIEQTLHSRTPSWPCCTATLATSSCDRNMDSGLWSGPSG